MVVRVPLGEGRGARGEGGGGLGGLPYVGWTGMCRRVGYGF